MRKKSPRRKPIGTVPSAFDIEQKKGTEKEFEKSMSDSETFDVEK